MRRGWGCPVLDTAGPSWLQAPPQVTAEPFSAVGSQVPVWQGGEKDEEQPCSSRGRSRRRAGGAPGTGADSPAAPGESKVHRQLPMGHPAAGDEEPTMTWVFFFVKDCSPFSAPKLEQGKKM